MAIDDNPGGITYYVSLSREQNTKGANLKISASANYTAPPDEDPEVSARKLVKAHATSLGVAAIAQASIEQIVVATEGDKKAIAAFIEAVNDVAATIAARSAS